MKRWQVRFVPPPGQHVRATEQRKIASTALFLASYFITADEPCSRDEPGGRRRRRPRVRREFSPLLVIERLKAGPDGTIQVPSEIVFHLGAEHFDLRFGAAAHYFTVPIGPAAGLSYYAAAAGAAARPLFLQLPDRRRSPGSLRHAAAELAPERRCESHGRGAGRGSLHSSPPDASPAASPPAGGARDQGDTGSRVYRNWHRQLLYGFC